MYSKTYFSATEVWYAHPSIWILLLLPYPPSNSQLQLFSIPTREEESHVSLDNETIMAVPDLLVAISNTSWGTLPYEFPPICPDLKAITIVPSLILVTHETEECHVNRGHAKLESFKVKAEVLTKTMKYCQHPSGIFNFPGIRLYIAMVECASCVHVHLVIIPQMGNQERDIPDNRAL